MVFSPKHRGKISRKLSSPERCRDKKRLIFIYSCEQTKLCEHDTPPYSQNIRAYYLTGSHLGRIARANRCFYSLQQMCNVSQAGIHRKFVLSLFYKCAMSAEAYKCAMSAEFRGSFYHIPLINSA